MNGFIHESVSKIGDGFGSALKLLAFTLLSALAFTPIKALFGIYGVVGLLALLFLLSVFYFYRSFQNRLDDRQKAWCGMASGVLFWQVTRYFPDVPGTGWFNRFGVICWLVIALLTALFWKKLFSVGLKFFFLTFLSNWLGWIYLKSLNFIRLWPAGLSLIYQSLHYLGIAGALFSIWWIVVRSRNGVQRKYAGLGLYCSILLTFLFF